MTVSTIDSSTFYNGNNSIVAFAIPFRFLDDGDLEVYLIDSDGTPVLQVITTDYTITGAGVGSGGEITFNTAPETGTDNVRIYRHVDPTQLTNFVNNDPFDAETFELSLDRLVMMAQTLFDRTGGATFNITDVGFIGRLSTDVNQWDAESINIQNVLDPTEPQHAATMNYVDAQTTLATGALLGINGVTNPAGQITFLTVGGGIAITTDDSANTITLTASPAMGSVLTVNTIDPDGSGEFTITAGSNITIGADTNGITINSTTSASSDAASLQGRALANTAPKPGASVIWDEGGSTWKPGGEVAIIRDVKSAGVSGGTFNAGSWETRDLNDLSDSGSIITALTSNTIKLVAGTYRCRITCPAVNVTNHQARLRNTTDGTTAVKGSSKFAFDSDSRVLGEFTTDGTKVYEVQHRCSASVGTIGFGLAVNFDEQEVYTVAEFTRLY